jgi:hypothetical protein
VPASKSFKAGQSRPSGHDPIPAGLDWDRWIGPAPFHEYLAEKYHPLAWRAWYDFGGGSIGDWGCHGLNLPFRALKLDYPTRITPDVPEGYTYGYPKSVRIGFEFSARKDLPPVKVWWYDGGRRPSKNVIPKSITEYFAEIPPDGVLILGEKGFTYGASHPGASYIQLAGEKKLSGILNHQASQNIPRSLPKSPGHVQEWIAACAGGPPTFSNFETGGRLTEIVQTGVVAIRAQQTLEWNGETMTAANAPTAAKYIRTEYRSGWQ